MAVPANTTQTFSRNSIREDLTDIISNIDPTETPFMSNIGKGKAKARLHEWQTENLIAANGDNKVVEGDDATAEARPATSRRNNYTQLMEKVVFVSDTSRAVDNAGYADELAHQMANAGKELKRDAEVRFCGNYAAAPGSSSVASEAAGAVAFLTTNADRGVGGADGTLSGATSGYVDAAATNGTLRTFTEAQLKTVMEQAWSAGGSPTMAIMSGTLKQQASTFTGIADQRHQATGAKATTIIGAADVYVSDFGNIAFVPSRFTTGRDVLVIDPSLWKVCDLQPYSTKNLGDTGHSEKRMIKCEKTLQCQNEAGNAVIADVQAA